MKLVIVHYHFRPGGIRRVIELATPHVTRRIKGIDSIVLACGEAGDRKWNDYFTRLLHPIPVEFRISKEFNYLSEQKFTASAAISNTRAALDSLLDDCCDDCIVWAHNLGIGRNLILARELARSCQKRVIPLFSHHHDWWFDNRWLRWPEMKRSGFHTANAVARAIFASPRTQHLTINHADTTILRHHIGKRVTWMPNPSQRFVPPSRKRTQQARQWLQKQLRADAPAWIVPCRLLRRKNIAEALLLTRWLRPGAWLVTTGGASSGDEYAYFKRLDDVARAHHWNLRLGVLAGDETNKPSVPELLAASEAVLLTSIQEGFGLPYLEAAAAARPLIARSLPNIAPDLAKFGFKFPQYYDELLVSSELFDWKAERKRQSAIFSRWLADMPRSARKLADEPIFLAARNRPAAVPFSRLTLKAQLEVLACPILQSWNACAPLNPFLKEWRKLASSGELGTPGWPRAADRWLSPQTYAERFADVTQLSMRRTGRLPAVAIQKEFLKKKLATSNMFPLLWTPDA